MAGISSRALTTSPENKFKYNGIPHTSELDLNYFDSRYSTYDPQVSRFLQVDPVTTTNESPYVAMGNNPVACMDWLGNYFTWSNASTMERYDRMKKENAEKITGYLTELANLDVNSTDKKVQGQIEELTQLVNMHTELSSQWKEMEESDIEFNVSDASPTRKDAEGEAGFVNNRVEIKIGPDKGNSETIAHELRHGYSFLNGELMRGGMLSDMHDEVVASNAGFLFLDRGTAGLVAKGYYNVQWFKTNRLNTPLYTALKGREESLTVNTLASVVLKYSPNGRVSFLLNANSANANLTIGQAMEILNRSSMRNPTEFQFQNLLKNR